VGKGHSRYKPGRRKNPPSSKKLARLTPGEDAVWNTNMEFYLEEGHSNDEASELAWNDLLIEFPRLRKYDGIKNPPRRNAVPVALIVSMILPYIMQFGGKQLDKWDKMSFEEREKFLEKISKSKLFWTSPGLLSIKFALKPKIVREKIARLGGQELKQIASTGADVGMAVAASKYGHTPTSPSPPSPTPLTPTPVIPFRNPSENNLFESHVNDLLILYDEVDDSDFAGIAMCKAGEIYDMKDYRKIGEYSDKLMKEVYRRKGIRPW
jgi:hypothetical protein